MEILLLIADSYTISVVVYAPCLRQMCHFDFFNNSVKHWLILIIFGIRYYEETWCRCL